MTATEATGPGDPQLGHGYLMVISSIAAIDGGPSNAVLSIATALRGSGHSVQVVAGSVAGEAFPASLSNAQDAGAVIDIVALRRKTRFRFSPRLALAIWTGVCRADRVSIHGFYQFPGLWAALLCIVLRRRFVLQPHGALEPYQQTESRRLKSLFLRLAGSTVLKQADSVNVASESEADGIRIQYPYALVKVIGMGTPNPTLPVALRDGSSPGIVQILYLSRIAPKKRLDVLLESVLGLETDGWSLHIAGTGDSSLESSLHKVPNGDARVVWLGHVDGAAKERLFHESDIFVLPSENENFGQVVTEAMRAGLPVITTKFVGAHVEVERAECGIVIEGPDTGLLREALTRLLADPELRISMGRNAIQHAERHLSWKSVASKFVSSFEA